MTPWDLFKRRLLEEWRFQYRVWRTVLDWTVILYLGIPALVFLWIQYRSGWEADSWIGDVPSWGWIGISYLFLWSGKIRLGLREGDLLFLRQQRKWMQTLMGSGLVYSFLFHMLATGGFLLLSGPLLIGHWNLSREEVGIWGVFLLLVRWDLSLFRCMWASVVPAWKRWMGYTFFGVGLFPIWAALVPWSLSSPTVTKFGWILAAVVAWFLLRCRLTAEGLFLDDVAREQEYRLRFVAWFLQGGGVLPRRKDFQPRRPWLLRRSQPLFRQRTCAAILAESVLKPLLRLGKHLRVYLQMAGLLLVGVLWVPGPMKAVVSLLSWFLFYFWGRSCWREFTSSTGVSLFPWEKGTIREAFRIYTFWVTLPGFSLISLGTGWMWWGWAGLVVGAVAGPLSCWLGAEIGGRWAHHPFLEKNRWREGDFSK
uniref:ABC transporter permease n=1 Tax=Kroppenstedtia sanguinis TaxID=1380684 RepID=UPI003D1DE882